MCAPGSGILSPLNGPYYVEHPNTEGLLYFYTTENPLNEDPAVNYYWCHLTGTSMSTPFTAGVAALMMEENPNLTANKFRELLHSTNDWTEKCDSNPLGPLQFGWGILNAKDLMLAMMNETPTSVTDIETAKPVSTEAYDLLGRKVDINTYKGIIIQNGHKRILK